VDYEGRAGRLRERLGDAGVGALLVTSLTNVRYLTGFSGSNGQLLVRDSGTIFFSDPRYAARASDTVQAAEVAIYPTRLTDLLPERLKGAGVARLGVEADSMTLSEREQLAEKLDGVELVATTGVVEDLRRVKDPEELALIREAVRLADETFAWVLENLAPGVTEREVALDIEVHMRTNGAEAVSFEPIVAAGELSAHIHHTASTRTLEKGDLVLLDFGSKYEGYCSDLTRTIVLGPATDEQRALYDIVGRAQGSGIAAVSAGVDGRDADAAARGVISEAGYAELFGHGLGHGVGLEIHEAPRLHRAFQDRLRAGEVVTVEPGVYRVGFGGVRIEDCVVVTDSGAEVLGTAPKDDLIEL
jgi:Xaa-Pro aminopeptidase